MSEKRARQKRTEQAPQSPVEQQGAISVNDLLLLLGTKDAEIFSLQRQVGGLKQQVQMLAERLAEKVTEPAKSS